MTANISDCGRYRYNLTRMWDSQLPRVLFVMLNPSTADAYQDDPTIRKCIGFAKRWGCGSIEVVNLFAWRATDPRDLKVARDFTYDIVGPENMAAWESAKGRCDYIIAAWGANKLAKEQEDLFASTFGEVECLGFTNDKQPRHPLMLAYATEREVF